MLISTKPAITRYCRVMAGLCNKWFIAISFLFHPMEQ